VDVVALQQKLRDMRSGMEEGHAIRLHRALSWVEKATELIEIDQDNAFINSWIAFNACYANAHNEVGDGKAFQNFAVLVTSLDSRIYDHLWQNYSRFVKNLVSNKFVYEPFWISFRNKDNNWREGFDRQNRYMMTALANNDAAGVLQVALSRLYTLRNQLVHGGATYGSYVNREQVQHGARLMLSVVPVIVDLMIDHRERDWGDIPYPVVKDKDPVH